MLLNILLSQSRKTLVRNWKFIAITTFRQLAGTFSPNRYQVGHKRLLLMF